MAYAAQKPVVLGQPILEVSALRRACAVEKNARFPDFQGRQSTFSQFMRRTAEKLARHYPLDSRWSTIVAFFRSYPNLDVATRITVIRRVQELLEDEKLPPVTKTTQQTSQSPARKDDQPHPCQVDVQYVRGVGPKMAELLNRLEIFTAFDLIRHFPRQHLDFQNRVRIGDLQVGQEVTIFGAIRSIGAFQPRNKALSILSILIHDGTGGIMVTRFIGGKSNQHLLERLHAQYPKNSQVMASGRVEHDYRGKRLELKNAEIEILSKESSGTTSDADFESIHAGRLVPVYRLTEGLSLRYLRSLIKNALDAYQDKICDPLPQSIIDTYRLRDLPSAIRSIHFPENLEDKEEARQRLVFDEFFQLELRLAWKRHHEDTTESALSLSSGNSQLIDRFVRSLPFQLTGAQERVFREIAADMASAKPMHRLVQGDVGSGKTVVAIMALLIALENGYQGAIMAPTEILAEQHYRQFVERLSPLGIRCALLVGKQGKGIRKQIQQDLCSGQIQIVVGTHALIQDCVEFAKLGLIIIDEQHRFGVKQRAQLKAKGQNPQLLTMTATPIPRTLVLTLHGDLDCSEIDELPPGRQPVETRLLSGQEKRQLWDILRKEIEKGRQAYIVFPLIEESETLSAKAASVEYEKLSKGVFGDLRLGLVHGKLKPVERDDVMERFRHHELDILVSTTVIEVGVDVPNASIMVIENADRFGLAQLHQLRGRVGRGANQSYCYLLSEGKSVISRQRLGILCHTNDGFVVAEKDLQLRGPGEFLGTRQSGLPELCLSDLVNDVQICERAREAAISLIKRDPEMSEHKQLREDMEVKLQSLESEYIASG